jgi:hypothetical protein
MFYLFSYNQVTCKYYYNIYNKNRFYILLKEETVKCVVRQGKKKKLIKKEHFYSKYCKNECKHNNNNGQTNYENINYINITYVNR